MVREPTYLEMLLTRMVYFCCGKTVYKTFADRIALNGSEQVLDFGCGMGTVARHIATRLTNGHLICLDISQRWLLACRKTLRGYRKVSFLQAEAVTLPKQSFDIVYCHFVWHDIADDELERVVPALVDSLKDGGRLYFREPLKEVKKLNLIKRLTEQCGLVLTSSRITDVPLMGYALDNQYIRKITARESNKKAGDK